MFDSKAPCSARLFRKPPPVIRVNHAWINALRQPGSEPDSLAFDPWCFHPDPVSLINTSCRALSG